MTPDLLRALWRAVLLGMVMAGPAHAQVAISSISSAPETPLTIAQPVEFTAQASASVAGVLEYRWDFGDGTPRTPWLTESNAIHSYQSAGSYTLLLQVRHQALGLASATLPLVVRLPLGEVASQSTSIRVHPTRREVWLVNPDHDSVAVLDADLLTLIAEVDVAANPGSLAVDSFGQVWVTAEDDDLLQRIDPATRALTASIALAYGSRPVAVAFAADGQGYLALAGPGAVQRFDEGGMHTGTLSLAPGLAALTISADAQTLYASQLVSRNAQGRIWRVDTNNFSAALSIELPLDTSSPDSGTAARGVPNYIASLALTETGADLWYAAKKDNILRGMFREQQPLTFESSLRSMVGRVDTQMPQELIARRMDLDDAGRASALLLTPGSSHLFVAQESNNRVEVLDPWNRRTLASLEVGRAPRGIAYDVLTRRIWVQNFLSRTVSVFDVGDLLDDGISNANLVAEVSAANTEPLNAEILLGKQIFYNAMDTRMGQDGYFSCSACHLDGRSDGQVWDFTQLGEGLRNTTSLLGNAGMGRGPVHWTGNFDEIQDFEAPIRNLFGGTGFMDDADYFSDGRDHPLGAPKAGFSADLDALASYVSSLERDDRSPFRASDGSLSVEGQAGRAVFLALNCQRCHSGEAFTDSPQGLRHNVGTLAPGSGQRLGRELLAFDTPSLRGLFSSAPYLHDGSAETLEALMLSADKQGAHGDSASLSVEERQHLIAFLLQIDASEPAAGVAASLVISSPLPDAVFISGDSIELAISSDLPEIVRVDYRVDTEIVASAVAAPWTANWMANSAGSSRLIADVLHDAGQLNTLSREQSLRLLSDTVFNNGFETD